MERNTQRELPSFATFVAPGITAILFGLSRIASQYPSISLSPAYRFINTLTEILSLTRSNSISNYLNN